MQVSTFTTTRWWGLHDKAGVNLNEEFTRNDGVRVYYYNRNYEIDEPHVSPGEAMFEASTYDGKPVYKLDLEPTPPGRFCCDDGKGGVSWKLDGSAAAGGESLASGGTIYNATLFGQAGLAGGTGGHVRAVVRRWRFVIDREPRFVVLDYEVAVAGQEGTGKATVVDPEPGAGAGAEASAGGVSVGGNRDGGAGRAGDSGLEQGLRLEQGAELGNISSSMPGHTSVIETFDPKAQERCHKLFENAGQEDRRRAGCKPWQMRRADKLVEWVFFLVPFGLPRVLRSHVGV